MGLSMLGLSIGFFYQVNTQFMEILVLICLFTFVGSFILTQGTILFVYVPEIVQPPFVTISTIICWASAILVTTSFPLIREKSSNPALPEAFLFYAFLALVSSSRIIVFPTGSSPGKYLSAFRFDITMEFGSDSADFWSP